MEVPDDLLHLHRNFRSWLWVFLGLFISVRRWWKVVFGELASLRTPCSWIVTGHLRCLRTPFASGVYVDGVCAVGCNRSKVSAALEAVKVTLDAAGLQCSEVESDTSKQVLTDLQLDHKTRVLSLEASRIWRLRRGLEYAALQRHVTGDQVAKLIGHITWSCLLRRPLSLINAGYRFARTFGPRSGRVWPAVAQQFRWIASLLPLLTCNLASPWSPWVYATDASGGALRGYGVARRKCDPESVAAAVSCAERWRFSAEEFISAQRSVLIENERKAQKAAWLVVVNSYMNVLTCILPCWEHARELQTMPGDRAVFENGPSIILQPKSVWCVLFVSGGSLLEILRREREGKAHVGLLKAWENGCCSSWTTWPWF